MDRKLTVTVPIHVKGEAKGVKQQGGVLDFVTREIEVECLPADIPEHIEVDVTELMLNQGIRVRDIATGRQVEAGQRARHDARARGRHRRPRRRRRPTRPRRRRRRRRRPSPKSSRRARVETRTEAKSLKLIVGLGNPGAKYRDTRHNIGFQVVDEMARRARRAVAIAQASARWWRGRPAPTPMLLPSR